MHCYTFCYIFVITGLSVVSSFNIIPHSIIFNNLRDSNLLLTSIDVSGLTVAPVPDEILNAASGTPGIWADLSNALIITGGLAFFAYEKRPRGSARDDLIEMRDSTVANANLGAFSKKFIPKGTVIGRYPGFLLSMSDALASKESDTARKSAQSYFFAVDDEKVLDPTNKSGFLEDTIGFLGVLKTETLIARINEPPLGGDVNLYTEIKANGVTVFAERDIFANEELFMDYGRDYDRSSYIRPALDDEEIEQEEVVERKTAMKPITVAAAAARMEPILLQRDEAAAVQSKMQETLTSASRSGSSSSSPSDSATISSSSSMFDGLIGNTKMSDKDPSAPGESRSKGILGGGADSVPEKKGEITDAPQYRPALTLKESEKLLESLDTMSDDEVAAVLAKLKAAVGDRIKSEVSEALFNKNEINDSISRELKKELGEMKKMPRAAPVDPEMRKKYNKELDAIENELEKIYSDPIGVWTEFMKNPEKFLEEGEMGNLADDEDFQ